ncbi:Hypothetical predicted protein [Mytilus galloprovincialis]|uniref:Uncharacterized protein n=1 Tax=Mytilus galloprovincialis TaxID=29158 RepID=A0A8B6DH51_MYTGA|nr:Hypothetical predicted protein [Mytilus galloprovincialis]
METSPANIWTSDNLVRCISMCLQTLLKWFKNGFIPNYFIPEENLWKGNTDTRVTIVDILGSLLETSPIYLTEIKCDSVGIFLQNALPSRGISNDIDNPPANQAELEKSQSELDRFIYKLHMWTLDYIIKCAKELIIFAADEELDTCITLHNAIIHRTSMDCDPRLVLEHSSLDRRMASAYILPFLQTSLGSQLIRTLIYSYKTFHGVGEMREQPIHFGTVFKEEPTSNGDTKKRAALDKNGTVMTPSKRRRLKMYDETVGKIIAEVKNKKYRRSEIALRRRRVLASSILWSRHSSLRKQYGMSWTFAHKCSTLEGVWDNKKRSAALDKNTLESVEDFFKRPANSTYLPDKKHVSKKTLEPKILLIKVCKLHTSNSGSKKRNVTLASANFLRCGHPTLRL